MLIWERHLNFLLYLDCISLGFDTCTTRKVLLKWLILDVLGRFHILTSAHGIVNHFLWTLFRVNRRGAMIDCVVVVSVLIA